MAVVRSVVGRAPRGSIPKVRRVTCKKCKGRRIERWNIRTDSVSVKLISFEEDDRGRKWRHEYCDTCLRLAGETAKIDQRANQRVEIEQFEEGFD